MLPVIDWSHPLNRGLVARYQVLPHFSEGMWRDLVVDKHPNNLTFTKPPDIRPVNRKGGFGSAIHFSNYVARQLNPIRQLPANTDFTVSLWAKANSAYNAVVFRWGYEWVNCFNVQMNSNGWYAYINASGSNLTMSADMTDWHMHTWTKRYGDSYAAYYIDGVPGSPNLAGAKVNANIASSSADIELGGKSTAGYSGYWNGYLDDTRVWTRALSSVEVRSLYLLSTSSQDKTLRHMTTPVLGIPKFNVKWVGLQQGEIRQGLRVQSVALTQGDLDEFRFCVAAIALRLEGPTENNEPPLFTPTGKTIHAFGGYDNNRRG